MVGLQAAYCADFTPLIKFAPGRCSHLGRSRSPARVPNVDRLRVGARRWPCSDWPHGRNPRDAEADTVRTRNLIGEAPGLAVRAQPHGPVTDTLNASTAQGQPAPRPTRDAHRRASRRDAVTLTGGLCHAEGVSSPHSRRATAAETTLAPARSRSRTLVPGAAVIAVHDARAIGRVGRSLYADGDAGPSRG